MRPARHSCRAPRSVVPLLLISACAVNAHGVAHAADDAAPAPATHALWPMRQADALREQQRHAEALAIYERVLAADPSDHGAYRMRALTLSDMGSAQLAAEMVWRHPGRFPAHERERIENDRLARMVVWAGAEPVDPAHRHAEADAALAQIGQATRDAPRQSHWEATRLRTDTLLALNLRLRHRDTVAAWQALVDEGVDVPGYVLPAVGDSLLALRRPREAEAVLRRALEAQPDAFTARLLLAYALLEQERFDQAMPMFESLSASQPAWPRHPGATGGFENWDRFGADIALANARAAGHDTRGAAALLRGLAAIGPANATVQSALGAAAMRDGHPQAALQRYRIARTLDPDERQARIGLVEAARDLDRPAQAQAAFAGLRETYPDDAAVDRLGVSLDRHRGWQLDLSHRRGRNDADAGAVSSPLGSRDGGTVLQADSPLLGERWRIGIEARDEWARYPGREVHRRSLALGPRYRHDRLEVSVDAGRTLDDAIRAATWSVQAGWRFSDVWHGSLAWRGQDPEASLQARAAGVAADSVAATLAWTPGEATRADLRLRRLRYDDGNHRDSLDLSGRQRVLARPHLLLDAVAGASAGRGSGEGDAPYYNPARDAALWGGVRLDHIGWRRYEHAFRQQLEITAGPAWQRGHGTRWVPAVGYRHRWSLGDGSALEYGLDWSRPVYDGRRETRLGLDVGLHWGAAP